MQKVKDPKKLEAELTQIRIDKEKRTKEVIAKSVKRRETLTKEIVDIGFWDSKQKIGKKLRKKTEKAKEMH